MKLKLILMLALASYVSGFGPNPNDIFDIFMNTVRNTEGYQQLREVSIPDFNTELVFPWQILSVKADFSATRGTFQDLLSLTRVGDVVYNNQDGVNVIKIRFTLPVLKVIFSFWSIKAQFLSLVGWSGQGVTMTITRNKFDAVIHASNFGNLCNIKVFRLKMLEMAGVNVDINGFFVAKPIANVVVEGIIEYFNKYLTEVAEKYAINMFNSILEDQVNCQKAYTIALGNNYGQYDNNGFQNNTISVSYTNSKGVAVIDG